LNELLQAGEATRASLVAACSLSTGTVTNVIADLIDEGLVREAGQLPSDGGRPIHRLVPNSAGAYSIGADIGEHGIAVELFDLTLTPVDRFHQSLQPSGFDPPTIRSVVELAIAELQNRNADSFDRLVGFGLGLPGVVERTETGGATVAIQSLGWSSLRLDELIPDLRMPTFAENGAKTMATAESWLGASKTCRNSIAALVGRGVGAGFVEDGKLMRGATGSAGEWGHTKVDLHGRRCHCGADGCLEAYIGGTSIVERWAEQGGKPEGDDERDLATLLGLANTGDTIATRVIDETIDILGLGLSNLVNLLNPDMIVLGGWVGAALANDRLDTIRTAMFERCLSQPANAVRLEVSELGADSVALGAAMLPLQQLISGDFRMPPPARPNHDQQI
jgi:predicted NBD/HSP70 family sugar kinase